MSKQNRNIEGKLITRSGQLDGRAGRQPVTVRIPHSPDNVYDVLYKPNDSRPWHVVGTVLADGRSFQVSRHANERKALQRAQLERIREPTHKPTAKMLHKAGIDMRSKPDVKKG